MDTHPYKDGIVDDLQINCYKLHLAHMLYEIIHRKVTINEAKLEAVRNIQSPFMIQSKLEGQKISARRRTKTQNEKNEKDSNLKGKPVVVKLKSMQDADFGPESAVF